MIRNYLKIALRHISRNKLYAIINIIGLTVGLTAFLFIAFYIKDELSYDRYHSKEDRIYRMWEILELDGQGGEHSSSMQFPVSPTLLNDYSDYIEHSVRFFNFQQPHLTLSIDDRKFNEKGLFFVDSTVFKVFDWSLVSGDKETALNEPNSIIINQEIARKFFGEEDPVGKLIMYENGLQLKITGVLDEIPAQSHFIPRGLVSFSTMRQFMGNPVQGNNWVWNPCWTYILLKDNKHLLSLEQEFPAFVDKYFPDFIASQASLFLMPLRDIHLNSHLEYEIQPNGNKSDVFIFGIIGFFILIIASINFMNLATARSVRRAREVGVRKVLGGTRGELIVQFLGESLIMTAIATLLAMVMVELLLPSFNLLADKNFNPDILLEGGNLLIILATLLALGLFSGAYPAFYLSSFDPSAVLKDGFRGKGKSKWLRESLVVLQFTVSLGLIIGTIIVNRQFEFLQDEDPGFNEEAVIVIPTKGPIVRQFDAYRAECLSKDEILYMTKMNDVLGADHNVHEYNYEGMKADDWVYFPSLIVDEYFVRTFDMKIVEGRDFNEDIKTDDSLGVIVNEAMLVEMGWTAQEAIGKRFDTPHGDERIIGVVKNFNYVSLSEPINAFVLDVQPHTFFFTKYMAVRVKPKDLAGTLAHLEDSWNVFAPQFPFEYFFLDERLDQLYSDQATLRDLVLIFSLIAIFISCIGLFALTSFIVEQRTKEIGIRKILGAEAIQLMTLVGKEFIRLIVISFLIAGPLSYFLLNEWLSGFAAHVGIDFTVYLLTALFAFLLSLITISYHSYKVTQTDPVLALKYE